MGTITSLVVRCRRCGFFMEGRPTFMECTNETCKRIVRIKVEEIPDMVRLGRAIEIIRSWPLHECEKYSKAKKIIEEYNLTVEDVYYN